MKRLFPILLSLFLPLCAASASAAAFSPLQIGINVGHCTQLVDEHTPVFGLRLNLPLSGNDYVRGLDIGLLSCADYFTGLRLNAFSWTARTLYGVEISPCGMARHLNGIHVCGIGVVTRELCGLQVGLVPCAANANGLQIGLFDMSENVYGVQIGFVNHTLSLHGLQIGLVNYARSLHGLQIGLVNIVPESSIPCLPLLRASF